MPPKTRAGYYKKEKPAERELLTAGVGGVDTLDLHNKLNLRVSPVTQFIFF